MPKPYRRRKGKRGPFVGNYRVTIDGRDLNLETKDANEAGRRARLAVEGRWPPNEAATRTARAMLDPGRSAAGPAISTLAAVAADAPEPPAADPVVSGAPAAGGESTDAAATADSQPPPPSPPAAGLDAAVAAAATEAAGVDEDVAALRAEQEKQVEGELAEIMGELTQGTGGGELIDGVCDGAAAALLWLERKGVELGWKWTFQGYTGKRLVAGPQPERDHFSRKCLRVGLKGIAVVHFPELAAKLTPPWALAIGLIAGASGAAMGGQLIDLKTGDAETVASAAEKAAAAAQAPSNPPPAA